MTTSEPYSKSQQLILWTGQHSIDDKNEGRNGSHEVFASEPYFNNDFQKSLKDGLHLAKTISQCLEKSNVPKTDLGLNKILKTARDLSRFDTSVIRTVGIAGDSAAGKSSLINSLLDADLAHTGDQGSAVTSFVTEYKWQLDREASNIVVEAEYLKLEELNDQLKELLYSFRQHYAPDVKADVSGEELKKRERESQVAEDTLKAAFGNQPDFDVELLKDFSDGSSAKILSTLRAWAGTVKWPSGAKEGTWKASVDTADECRELTKQFMKDRLWPFTKIMRIYLHAPVLETGLILADLPGYRDLNFARVMAAQQYQANCDELFIVANINRAVTDQSIKATIEDYLGSRAEITGTITHPNITIVCTHAADINIKNAEKLNTTIEKGILEYFQQKIKQTKNGEYKHHDKVKTNYKYHFVTARNNLVTSQLQKVYAEKFAPNKLPVFCVDNNDYQDEDFALNKELTGIPHLRSFCLSVSARALFRRAHDFLLHLLPALLQSLTLWYKSNLSKKKLFSESGIMAAENLRDALNHLVDHWTTTFNSNADTKILKPLRTMHMHFNDGALRASREWESWHASSYRAYCRNNGTHSTKLQPDRCWNSDLLQVMNTDLRSSWELLDGLVRDNMLILGYNLYNTIDNAIEVSKENKIPTAFIGNLNLRKRQVQHMIGNETESCQRRFKMVKRDSTGHHNYSYIMAQMRPVYRRCGEDSGEGTIDRCKLRIRQKISSGTIFPSIQKATCAALQAASTETAERLKMNLKFICSGIDNDLKTMRNSSNSATSKKQKFKMVLKELLEAARKSMKDIAEMGAEARDEARERGYIPGLEEEV